MVDFFDTGIPNIWNPDIPEYEQYDPLQQARNTIWGFDIETNKIGRVSGAREFPLSIAFQQVQRRGNAFQFGERGINTLVYPPGTTSENYVPVLEKILNEQILRGKNKGKTIGELTGLKLEDWAKQGAVTQEELATQLHGLIGSSRGAPVFLGQNIQRFDMRVLSGVLERAGLGGIQNAYKFDTWERARDFDKARGQLNNISHYNLSSLAQRFNIPFGLQHEAGADLRATLGVANALQFGRYPRSQRTSSGSSNMPPPPQYPNYPQGPSMGGLPPSGVRGVRRNYDPSFDDFQEFQDRVATLLRGANRDVRNQVQVIPFEEQGFARFVVTSPTDQNPIQLDLAPGPRDIRGEQTLVEHYPSGWFGHWEPQIYAKSETDIRLTPSGFETLALSVSEAFQNEGLRKNYPDSPMKRFNILKYTGSPESGIVGRHAQQGPPHPSSSIMYAASRVSVGYGEGVENIDVTNANIMRTIRDAARRESAGVLDPRDQASRDWAKLAGFVPTKEDAYNLTRLTPLYSPYMENGELMVRSLGRKGIDPVKRQTLMMTGRERAFFYEYDKETGTTREATPQPVTGRGWKQSAGLRYATIPEYGETNRDYSVVMPGTMMTAATPLSGAMMMYKDPLATGSGKEIMTAAYPTQGKVVLPNLYIDQLQDIRFTFGLMRAVTEKGPGKEGERVVDYQLQEGATEGLKGVTLSEDQTHTIGYYQFGEGGPKTPIQFTTGGAPVTIGEEPRLYMPSHYLPDKSMSSGAMPTNPKAGVPVPVSVGGYDKIISRANRGMSVIAAGQEDQTLLQFGIGLWSGFGGKGWAIKQAVEEMPSLETTRRTRERLNPRVTLTGPGGAETRDVTALTGEVKDYNQAFAAAFRYADPQTQINWVGELARLKEENPAYETLATRLQEQLRGGLVEGRQTLSAEALASTFARTMYGEQFAFEQGEQTQVGRLYWTEMMANLRAVTEEMPATSAYQQYGWAKVGSQWIDSRAVTAGERKHLISSALGGAALTMKRMSQQFVEGDMPKNLTAAQQKRWTTLQQKYPQGMPALLTEEGKVTGAGMRAFKQVFPKGLGEFVRWKPSGNEAAPYIMSMRTGEESIYGTNVLYPEPEFMGKSPHIGLEEMIGLETQYSQIAQFMGMTSQLGPEGPVKAGTGFRTERLRAYQQMADVTRYGMARGGGGEERVPLAGRTVGAEQARELLRYISDAGDNPELPHGLDIGALQSKVEEVLGPGNEPLILPETVLNKKRVGAGFITPGTMSALSYSPFGTESQYYNPVDRLSKTYMSAFTGFLQEAAGHRTSQATTAYEQEQQELFRDATDVLKNMQSYQLGGAISGRYGAATGIGLGTSIISQQQLDRVLKGVGEASGIKGKNFKAWRAAAMQQLEALGGLPSVDTRWPFQSREQGYFATMAMTPEMIAKKTGVHFREATRLVGKQVIPGSPWSSGIGARLTTSSTAFSGDWDYDTLMKMGILAANPDWEKTGEALQFPQQILDVLGGSENKRLFEVQQSLRQLLGTEAGHAGGAKDVLAAQWTDIMESVSPFVTPKTGARRGDTGTFSQRYEQAWMDAEAYIKGGKGGMGAEFNLQRLLTSVSGALGVGDKIRTASGAHYQTPLDFMYDVWQQRGGQSRLQTMMQSAIYATAGDKQSGQLIYMPHAKSKHVPFWGEDTPQQTLISQLTGAVQADYEEMANVVGLKMPKQFMGGLFAMKNRPQDVEWLSSRFEAEREKGVEGAMYRAITGKGGYADYLAEQDQAFNLYDTTAGRAMHVAAQLKITPYRPGGRPPRKVEVLHPSGRGTTEMTTLEGLGQRTFFTSQNRREMLMDMVEDPINKAAMISYTHTSRGGILPPEDVSHIQRLMEQRVSAGLPVPAEWRHISAMYRGEADVAAMQRAQAAQQANYTPEQILKATQEDVSSTLHVTGSQLAKLAGPSWREHAGIPQEWTQREYARVLAQNSMRMGSYGITGSNLDALFEIDPANIARGQQFQNYVGSMLRQPGRDWQSLALDIPRGTGPQVNLEDILTASELKAATGGRSMSFGMTPDVFGLQASGRAFLGEAKAGSSQAISGQLQAYTYAFALQRLAGYDPITGGTFSRGNRSKFTKAISPMLAARDPFYQGAATQKEKRAILENYYQAYRKGDVDVRMFMGQESEAKQGLFDPLGNPIIDPQTGQQAMGPVSWLADERGITEDPTTLHSVMLEAFRNASLPYTNADVATGAQSELANLIFHRPDFGIPFSAAMLSARRRSPQTGVRSGSYIPGETRRPKAPTKLFAPSASGGGVGDQPPVVGGVAAAEPEPEGRGFEVDWMAMARGMVPSGGDPAAFAKTLESVFSPFFKMFGDFTKQFADASRVFMNIDKNGVRMIHGGAGPTAKAGAQRQLSTFRDQYGLVESEQEQAVAAGAPIAGPAGFSQRFATGAAPVPGQILAGGVDEQLSEAGQNDANLRHFIRSNWPEIKRLAALKKTAAPMVERLNAIESLASQDRPLLGWEREAITMVGGHYRGTTKIDMHPHAQGIAESADIASRLFELGKGRYGFTSTSAIPREWGYDIAGQQGGYLQMNRRMMAAEGLGYWQMSGTERKQYMAEDRYAVARWRTEAYRAREASMLQQWGGQPEMGTPEYDKWVMNNISQKSAQDRELAASEKMRMARIANYQAQVEGGPAAWAQGQMAAFGYQAFNEQLAAWQAEAPGQRVPIAPQRAYDEGMRKWRQAAATTAIQKQAALQTLQGYGMLPPGAGAWSNESQLAQAFQLVNPQFRENVMLSQTLQSLPAPIRAQIEKAGISGNLQEIHGYIEGQYGKLVEQEQAWSAKYTPKVLGAKPIEEQLSLQRQYSALTARMATYGRLGQDIGSRIGSGEAVQKQADAYLRAIQTEMGLGFEPAKMEQALKTGTAMYEAQIEAYGKTTDISQKYSARNAAIARKYSGRELTEKDRIEKAYEEAMSKFDQLTEEVAVKQEETVKSLEASAKISTDRRTGLRRDFKTFRQATTAQERISAARRMEQRLQERAEGGEDVADELGQATKLRMLSEAERATATEQEAAQSQRAEYTGAAGRLGGLARRMFGGFGLMYLRSILGLVGTGAYTGFGQRQQLEAEMAQPFLGLGGEMPATTTEEQRRILATQYGGSGGIWLGGAKNLLMREQQGLYQLGTTALSGVSAGGMAMWLAGSLGNLTKTQELRVGGGVALGMMGLNELINIAGARSDVQGTAMNLAVRRARGDNLWGQVLSSTGAGIAAGATLGTMMGGNTLAGAAIGGVLGLGSNYQQVAEWTSSDIRKEAEVLQALAERGPRSVVDVLADYEISEDRAPYYARLSAEVQSVQEGNLGISTQAIAAREAWQLKTGARLSVAEQRQMALSMQGGFNAGQLGLVAGRVLGIPISQMYQQLPAQGGMVAAMGQPAAPVSMEQISKGVADAMAANPNWNADVERQRVAEAQPGGQWQETLAAQFGTALEQWKESQALGPEVAGERATAAFQAISAFGLQGMKGAQAAVGPVGEAGYTGEQIQKLIAYGERLEGIQVQGWGEAYATRRQAWARMQAMGYGEAAGPEPTIEEYEGLAGDEVEAQRQMIAAQMAQVLPNMAQQIQMASIQAFGHAPITTATTGLGMTQQQAQIQFGAQMGQTFMQGGMTEAQAGWFGEAFTAMTPQQFQQYQGLFSLQPMRVADWAFNNPQMAAGLVAGGNLRGAGGAQINPLNLGLTDVNAQGQLTGMAWGTTSLARPMEVAQLMAGGMAAPAAAALSSQNSAAAAWGANWQQTGGAALPWMQAMATGGQFAAQAYQQKRAGEAQLASAGNQLAMLALQAEYMPKFWALEDRSRALGYAQTEWGFGQQERQMEMQQRFFYQNIGLQQEQMQMQRGWTREDWAYNDQMRAMQWGWRVEDFEEQSRFMTGRQRRLAERQMGRETLTHDLETEQYEKQKDRQQELWDLEDRRFQNQIAQYQEQLDMQKESLAKQREFFEERKQLEAEQTALQREYWQKQHDLQVAAAGAQAAYAAEQVAIAEKQMEYAQWAQEQSAQPGLANPDTLAELALNMGAVIGPYREFLKLVQYQITLMGGEIPELPNTGGACFVSGTMVVMADDSKKPIDRISIGDYVLSYNPHTEEIEEKRVINTIHRSVEGTVRVRLSAGTYECSMAHPWYTKRGWINARNLNCEDEILTLDNEWEKIETVTYSQTFSEVFNITVAGNSNYYVDKYLTHNAVSKAIGGPIGSDNLALVGENGPEYLKLPFGSSVLPNDVLKAMAYGDTTFSDPWNTTMSMGSTPARQESSKDIVLVINIGNERLERFVVKAVSQSLEVG